jgi:outer membrane protein assembly factor BamB
MAMTLIRDTMRWLAPAMLVAVMAGDVAAAERRDEVSTPLQAIRAQAAREGKPLWRLPLAGALIEDMQLIAPDRLLVALRADDEGIPNLHLMLVDSRNGLEVWRHPREQKNARWDTVLADNVSLVYRVDDGRKVQLICLDAASGTQSWARPLAPAAVPLANRPHGTLLVVEPGRSHVTLRSLSLQDGNERWKREVTLTEKGASPPRPVLAGEDAIHFYRGIERLTGADGIARWTRADLRVPDGAPDARLDGDVLFVVTAGAALVELDAATGVNRHTVQLPADAEYDAIETFDNRVYLRGARLNGGASVLVAVDRKTGQLVWTHECEAPPMSNLIEDGDRVFYATAGEVVALDAASGRQLGKWEATNASRPYPVHLRRAGGKIVYIGEVMVAAFDPRTGTKAWSRGWTPISNHATLASLDASLPRLRDELASLAGQKSRGARTGSEASYARVESARFQNMAADYSRRGTELSARIDSRSPELSQNMRRVERMGAQLEHSSAANAISGDIAITRMNQSFDRAQSMMNFQFAMMDLAIAMERAKAIAATKTELARQLLFRRAVVGGYSRMEDADYVYRPGMEFAGAGGPFVGVTVVQLSTGRMASKMLSPSYRDYGLWNLVDVERGVIYHHGVGMNESLYHFLPPRNFSGKPTSIVGNFLIAQSIRIPE